MLISDPIALIQCRQRLRVSAGTIHVWPFALKSSAGGVAQGREYLSREERERADRFVFAADREEYVVAHGVVRSILGRYTGIEPDVLQFSVGSAGKPRLTDVGSGDCGVSFNLSHSGGRALLAVSDGREVGVDIERLREGIDVLAISSRYFFGPERDTIEGAPPARRREQFLRYWVAKEAVLKAAGIGISLALDRFQVDFQPDAMMAGITTHAPNRLAGDWTIRILAVEPGWAAAVSAASRSWTVRLESVADA